MRTTDWALTLVLAATVSCQSIDPKVSGLPICVAKYSGKQSVSVPPPAAVKPGVLTNYPPPTLGNQSVAKMMPFARSAVLRRHPQLKGFPVTQSPANSKKTSTGGNPVGVAAERENQTAVQSALAMPSGAVPSNLSTSPALIPSPTPTNSAPANESSELPLRFRTTGEVLIIKDGDGLCGEYSTDTYVGACLWSGTDSTGIDAPKAGWLNSASQAICGDELWVSRASNLSQRIPVKVVTGCDFGTNVTPEIGCNQLYLTKLALTAFAATPDEIQAGRIKDLAWDFQEISKL